MRTVISTLTAGTLALAAAVAFAQTPPAPSGEPRARPTPEQREKIREAFKSAREACKDNADRRACMTEQMCAKASDPARCQERAREHHARMSKRMDERQAAHEACTGKRGEELAKCLGEQRKHRPGQRREGRS